MAAPKFAPVASTDVARTYESPEVVPAPWEADRPAEIHGRQPVGEQLGYQGPDQGYALRLARRFRDRIVTTPNESVDDAVRGSLNIALRRASLFGRAPVAHDLTIALTMWGWLDASPSSELLTRRRELFEGVANTNHHYAEGRAIADLVPEATLRMSPAAVQSAYTAGKWRDLTGA
jgi:hypothetical protein